MNVLVVSQYFWPESFRINDLVKALLSRGVEVDILTGQPNYPIGRTFDGYRARGFGTHSWEGATLHRVPLAPRGQGSALGLIRNYASFVISGILLAPFMLRKKRVDVIFVYAISPILQAIPAIFVKWVKGGKLVVWVQDLWPESLEATGFVRNRFALALVRKLVRWIYSQTDLILVQSEAFIGPVAELADIHKIKYYPNSAEAIFSSEVEVPVESLPQGLDGFAVVFAGNLGSAQALGTIIEAAELLGDNAEIRFVLVGGGSRAGWINEQIASRGLNNVHVAGQYPIEAMPAILRAASALLVTLNDDAIFYHTIPSKVQAYLAVGRPIIACLNGEGARIITEADAGIACAAEDAVGLAKTVRELYEMTGPQRDRLGVNGKRYFADHFDGELLTDKLIDDFQLLTQTAK